MAISIYQYPQVLNLTLGSIQHNCELTGTNMIVSQHYTNSLVKLFRNIDQRVDLLLKDWDRHAIKLEDTQTVRMKIFDNATEIMTKDATLIDFDRGQYALDFTASDTGNLVVGQFTYCIVIYDSQTHETRMLFTNQDYGAAAPLAVLEGPLPVQAEALSIDPTVLPILSDFYTTSALKGAAQTNNRTGVHSLTLVLANYTGAMTIEGTLDEDIPMTDDSWTTAKTVTYVAQTGTIHETFTANYNWVRLKFTTNTGITSISYRNA